MISSVCIEHMAGIKIRTEVRDFMTTSYVQQLKAKKRRLWRVGTIVGLLFFLTFIAYALFGDSGILVNLRVKREYRQLRGEQDLLQAENHRLREEINALRTSKRKIEEVSRREFGFGRPGEIIFYFPEEQDAPVRKLISPRSQREAEASR